MSKLPLGSLSNNMWGDSRVYQERKVLGEEETTTLVCFTEVQGGHILLFWGQILGRRDGKIRHMK